MKNLLTRMRANQRGDTIVEVVLALTVLGLVLSTSSVLANRNTKTLQTSQENTYALRVAQSQLEYVKAYVSSGASALPGTPFCMNNGTERIDNVATCKITNGGAEYTYTLQKSDTDEDGYNVKAIVKWDTLTGTPGNVELTYRVYTKSGASVIGGAGGVCSAGWSRPSEGADCVPNLPMIQANVKIISPDATNKQRGCSYAGDKNFSGGVNVRINPAASSGSSKPTNGSGTATFSDLTPNIDYSVSLPGSISGYDICNTSSNPSSVIGINQAAGDPARVVNFKVQPKCSESSETTYGAWTSTWSPAYGNVPVYDWVRNPATAQRLYDLDGYYRFGGALETGPYSLPGYPGKWIYYKQPGGYPYPWNYSHWYHVTAYDPHYTIVGYTWGVTHYVISRQDRTVTISTTYKCTGFSDRTTTTSGTETRYSGW